ncbi:MAG: helix-turn-helix transcriptional regulator [Armatimonadia bacterium]
MQSQEDESARQAFGRVIRALRHEVGISQEELAERAGLHRTYISMVERGIKTPTVVTLVDLARAVGMQTGELMTLFDREIAASEATAKNASRARGRHSRGGGSASS